ncbi:MAG TPA: hypothetical protein VKW06_07840 [Candidatus Angelobacter sp.]|nr:hypothetical protein [Candidatus Angelobacter sp.]
MKKRLGRGQRAKSERLHSRLAILALVLFVLLQDRGGGRMIFHNLRIAFAFLKIPQYDFAGAGAAAAGIGGGFSAGGKAESLIPYPQFAEPLYS